MARGALISHGSLPLRASFSKIAFATTANT